MSIGTTSGNDSVAAGDAPRTTDDPGRVRAGAPGRLLRVQAGTRRAVLSALVAVVAALASFKLRTVPVPTDPWHYLLAGMTFPEPTWLMAGLTRYGMVLPMVPITHLFNESELSYFLTPCLATGLLVGGTYWLADRFFGVIAGLAAAVLTLLNGVVLVNASRLYPDVPGTAMVVLAVVVALMARDAWERNPRLNWRIGGLLVLAGVLVGLSWWMRETSLFAWPVVAAVLLWPGGSRPRFAGTLAAAGALAMLVIEVAVSQWAFGDPLARIHAVTGPDLSATTNPADLPYLNQSRVQYLLTIPRGFHAFTDGDWMIAIAVIAVIAGLLFPRRVGLFAGWFALVFILFAAAGGGLRPGQPNIRLDVARYWIAFIPPMVIAAVGGVTLLARALADRLSASETRRRWGQPGARVALGSLLAVALVLGPVVASAQGVRANPSYVTTNGNVGASFRNWLHAHNKDVHLAYSDWMSARVLPVYTRSFSGDRMATVTWLSLTGPRAPRAGDYVVLYSAYNQVCFFCNANMNATWLPKHKADLRRWDKVWQSRDRTFVVYRVTAPAKSLP